MRATASFTAATFDLVAGFAERGMASASLSHSGVETGFSNRCEQEGSRAWAFTHGSGKRPWTRTRLKWLATSPLKPLGKRSVVLARIR